MRRVSPRAEIGRKCEQKSGSHPAHLLGVQRKNALGMLGIVGAMIANRERLEFHGVPVRVRKQGIPAGCDWVAVFKNGSMIGSNGFTAPPGSAKITAHRLPTV